MSNTSCFPYNVTYDISAGSSVPSPYYIIVNYTLTTPNKYKRMTIAQKLRNLFRNETDKKLYKLNVVNDAGELTNEGREAFIDYLFQNNKEAFAEKLSEIDK